MCVFFFHSSGLALPGYRWGANWCRGMQLCWLLNCQGAKSKGVSFVNYTQCYKQSCSFQPFLSSTSHKYFGSGTKKEEKKKQFTHNYHSGMSGLPADVCFDYNGSRGRASLTQTRCVSYNHNRAVKHWARCKAHRSPLLERIRAASKTLVPKKKKKKQKHTTCS